MSGKHMRKNIKPLIFFIKPYPFHLMGVIFLILIASVLEAFNILAIFGLLKIAFTKGLSAASQPTGSLSYFIAKIIDLVPFSNKVLSAVVLLSLIIAIKCLFNIARRFFTAWVSCKIWHDVQFNIFNKCIYADYQFFLNNKEGEIVYRGFTAPAAMGVTLQYSCEFLAEIIKLIMILGVLFALSFKTSSFIAIFAVIFYLFISMVARKVTYFIGKGRRESSIKQNIMLTELVNGIKPIKIFLAEKRWVKNFDDAMKRYFKLYVKDETWRAMPPNVLELLAFMLLGFLLLLYDKGNSQISPAELSVLGIYVYAFSRLIPSFKNISAKRMGYEGNLAIIEKLYEFCNKDLNNITDGDIDFSDFKNAIRFENVNFSYPNRKDVIKDVNLSIEKGKATAVVGKSGSGKTTLINLILRLFIPGSGKILVDELDLNNLKADSWLQKIGFVAQDTFMFNASIRENIIFGRGEDEEKMLKASKLANADEFITELEDGYETLVGDRGMKLSGGQRQRIAIARAMYNDPEILIFDEATSSLDNLSELMIKDALERISTDHTLILVAHRLSTVINADKIIVLDEGRIIEEGTHKELMDRGEYYNQLYRTDTLTKVNRL